MNDLISRQAAIDVLEERLHANGYSNVALVSELHRSIGYLMQLPSAQQEIVRCSECIYADGYDHCKLVEWWNVSDDFCSRGEKREDDIHTEHSRSSEDDWDYLMHNAREKLHEQLKIKEE